MARRIGVDIRSGITAGPSNAGAASGVLHIAGITERGPVGAAGHVRSIGDFETAYGARTPYSGNAYDAARTYFAEGGNLLLVSRVVGPDAERASAELTTGGEEPEAVVRVTAGDPGTYANTWTVEVSTGDADGLNIIVVDGEGETVAAWRNVTSAEELAERASAFTAVTIQTLHEGAEFNLETGSTGFSGGSDDRSNATIDDVFEALESAGDAGRGGTVALPGYTADVVGGRLMEYAARNWKIALLAGHRDASVGEIESLAAELVAAGNGDSGGLFWPHVRIPDGSTGRVVSPEAAVAGARARLHADGRFWSRPAGQDRGRFQWVTSTAVAVSDDLIDRLDESQVNGIRSQGRYLNNWTSLSTDQENLGLISDRDTLNSFSVRIKDALEPYVWEDIDGRGYLLSDIESEVTAILADVAEQGGLYAWVEDGEERDPGYLVVVNATNNPASVVAGNRVVGTASVRLSPAAKLIEFTIYKTALGADL